MALRIARQAGADQVVAKEIVQATLDAIVAVLATEGRLEPRDFGVFEVRVTKARKARNPWTGEEVMVPEGRRVKFEAVKEMAERVADDATPASEKTAAPAATGSHPQP
ncbi:MAG: HU family DNA-binding protein [Planctomycetota bacterium]|nr:HU family DNA-binding protein [Planctomycetota bacterium]